MFSVLLLCLFINLNAIAQHDHHHGDEDGPVLKIGTAQSLVNQIKSQTSKSNQRTGKPVMDLQVGEGKKFRAHINYKKSESQTEYVTGEIADMPSSSFYLRVENDKVEGNIIVKDKRIAYKYSSDESGNAYIQEVDINDLLCIDYDRTTSAPGPRKRTEQISAAVANLQSLPGAAGCILLDFDGHYVSGTPWNGGNPINAAPSGMSDADITEHWEVVAEDFRPFNLNVTTNESVFNTYPKNRRMRVIITPTNTAAPGAGGVAYIGSFAWNDDTPCWTFILSGKSGGEASSHEVGHTFGLGHDGRTSPSEGYFQGHGNWAPIMGVGYYRSISQWSRGEYANANNLEDDLAKISGTNYGVGYRADDHGNAVSNATEIRYNSTGQVSSNENRGIIERTTDLDFFAFTTGGGNVVLNFNTVSRHGNLDILVRLYNQSGSQIGSYNPAGLNASMNVNLAAGRYFVSVDGTGAGNPATDGYSDYASLGSYFISGTIPPAQVNGIAIMYKDCSYGGYAVGLNTGDYNLSQLRAAGILDNDISSLRVRAGYEAILFDNDNFSGPSITLTGDVSCLVAHNWNDRATSVRIRLSGVTNIAGTYYLQNRHSGLYMDVANFGTADGTNILQWNYTGNNNQQFEFVHLGNGTYRITPKVSNKCLDVAGVSTANGANVHQWTYVGGGNQQFVVQDAGNGFYRFVAVHSGKVIEVAGFSTQPNGNIQQWDNTNQASSHWRLVPVSTPYANVIQAENFSNMNGIQTEPTSDAGGGLNVGWIDANDWMVYNSINFPYTGTYTISYRVASPNNGGRLSIDLNAGSVVLGQRDIPNTGGWQNWTTVSHDVHVNAGTYNVGIFALTGGWNINWFRISSPGASEPVYTVAKASDMTEADASQTFNFNLYPNPAENFLTFRNDFSLYGANVKIMDAMGYEVMNEELKADDLNIADLKSGLYTIIVSKEGYKFTRKFVKQ